MYKLFSAHGLDSEQIICVFTVSNSFHCSWGPIFGHVFIWFAKTPQMGLWTEVYPLYLYWDISIFIWYKHLNIGRHGSLTFRLPFRLRPKIRPPPIFPTISAPRYSSFSDSQMSVASTREESSPLRSLIDYNSSDTTYRGLEYSTHSIRNSRTTWRARYSQMSVQVLVYECTGKSYMGVHR